MTVLVGGGAVVLLEGVEVRTGGGAVGGRDVTELVDVEAVLGVGGEALKLGVSVNVHWTMSDCGVGSASLQKTRDEDRRPND